MTTLAAEVPLATPSRARTRAITAVCVHSVCDYFSFVLVALLPLFTTQLGLSTAQKAVLLGVGSVCSGVIQPIVAWLSDRFDTRVLSTFGLLLAVVSVSAFGFAQTYAQLLTLQALATTGVGAFHPPAAAAVGRLFGRRRSLGMSVFFLFGMMGGMAGNITAPRYVGAMAHRAGDAAPDYAAGLASLVWLLIPGLAACLVLAWAIHRTPHRHHGAHEHHSGLGREERRARWATVGILYAANVIRFSVNMALVYLYTEWAQAHARAAAGAATLTDALGARASELNGYLQASMQLGMGGAGLALGFLLAPRFEKHAFVTSPALGAAAIAAIPWLPGLPDGAVLPAALALSVFSGVGFGSVIPVSMAVAQRLLPHRTSLASGMMLGGAWAFAFVGPILAERIQIAAGLDAAFYATAGTLALAGVLCTTIRGRLLTDAIDHH